MNTYNGSDFCTICNDNLSDICKYCATNKINQEPNIIDETILNKKIKLIKNWLLEFETDVCIHDIDEEYIKELIYKLYK